MTETTTDTATAAPVIETVTCLILHCHRCNVPFRDDSDDDYSGVIHWRAAADIVEQFNKGLGEYGGWRRFGDRYVCGRCQISNGYGDDPDAREVPEPLPAAEADKVTRAQIAYKRAGLNTSLDRLVGAAEDVLAEAEQAETNALFSGAAEPTCMRSAAMRRLREAINALPLTEQEASL